MSISENKGFAREKKLDSGSARKNVSITLTVMDCLLVQGP